MLRAEQLGAGQHKAGQLRPGQRALALALAALMWAAPVLAEERFALIISGASGGAEYAAQYAAWTDSLTSVLTEHLKLDADNVRLLREGADPGQTATAGNVRRSLAAIRQRMGADDLLLLVLIGHGTFDGVDAKFNLVGPDLEATQWAELLDGLPGRVVVVNTSAASFPFLERMKADRRIVITATDSAAQRFDTVFPEYFISAFRDEAADIDKNSRVSIWEAFAFATAGVRRHYQQRGQLATERALLDDNGDGVGREASAQGEDGSSASRTYLDRPMPGAAPTDEVLLGLLQRRAALEAEAEELKIRRSFLPPDEYRREFERIMIELARVSRDVRARVKS
ncbi:MAG TPA: hypothetical protein VD833_10755 [Vicinamibacterales bacterium]|nr:hypothetical protein [Vicinamibacterales bacterium]